MEQPRFRFSGKEVAVLIIGTALAIGSLRAEDPLLVVPMLVVSWIAFLYICAVHEGSVQRRLTTAVTITLLLASIGIRLFWPSVHEELRAFLSWLTGSHGRWFDRLTGAISLVLLTIVWRWMRAVGQSARSRRRAIIDGMPKGFIDYKVDVEQALTAMPVILAKLGTVIGEVGPMLEKRSAQLQRAGSAVAQAKIFAETSSSLDRYSTHVDRIRVKFVKTGEMLSSGLTGWFKWIESERPSKASMGVFPVSMAEFRGNMDRSNGLARTYIDVLRHTQGASRILDLALEKHIQLMEDILKTNMGIYNACGEALRVFEGLS